MSALATTPTRWSCLGMGVLGAALSIACGGDSAGSTQGSPNPSETDAMGEGPATATGSSTGDDQGSGSAAPGVDAPTPTSPTPGSVPLPPTGGTNPPGATATNPLPGAVPIVPTGTTESPAVGTTTVAACNGDVAVSSSPFGCGFAWGATTSDAGRASSLDFLTVWVGYEHTQGREGDCDGCRTVADLAGSTATPVFYAYFAGYALPDCNVETNPTADNPNLCTGGAAWIRDNRERYVNLYADYARQTFEAAPNKSVVWLLEGDFVQYTYDDQSAPFTMQELGELASEITCTIKANAPNAIVAINHSAWIANEETDAFWNAMPLDVLDMIWTTGVGNNDGFIQEGTTNSTYNAATATYAYLSNLTGKGIWVDTSFGLSQQQDSWTTAGADQLNQRIAEGVLAANITDPADNYDTTVQALRPELAAVCN